MAGVGALAGAGVVGAGVVSLFKGKNPASRAVVHTVDSALTWWQGGAQHCAENIYTKGPFTPQPNEVTAVAMELLEGEIPAELCGAYLRVGPNPVTGPPSQKRYHIFDGDGMLHVVRFKGGKALYSNAFLRTNRQRVEKELQKEYFMRIGEIKGVAGIAKAAITGPRLMEFHDIPMYQGGPANTHTLCFDGDLFALNEGDVPFELRIADNGSIRSVGFNSFGGSLNYPFSAHPKLDQQKNQLIFHGYGAGPPGIPPLKFGIRSAGRPAGELDLYTPIKTRDGSVSFAHDFAITEHYIVIIDGSVKFSGAAAVRGEEVFAWEKDAKMRLGLLPRTAKGDETVWFECDRALGSVHTFNAYEEGDEVVLWLPVTEKWVSDFTKGGNRFKVAEFRLSMPKEGAAPEDRQVRMSYIEGDYSTEFPKIREDRFGYKCRFGYGGAMHGSIKEAGDFHFQGIYKFDFEEKQIVGRIETPGISGDPHFVARPGDGGEDDGWIVVSVMPLSLKEETRLHIYDARSFDGRPLAVLRGPHWTPLTFHTNFVEEAQLQEHLRKHGQAASRL